MKVLACECGFVARGADDEELVAVVQEHARTAHRLELHPGLVRALVEEEASAQGRAGRRGRRAPAVRLRPANTAHPTVEGGG